METPYRRNVSLAPPGRKTSLAPPRRAVPESAGVAAPSIDSASQGPRAMPVSFSASEAAAAAEGGTSRALGRRAGPRRHDRVALRQPVELARRQRHPQLGAVGPPRRVGPDVPPP